MATKETVFSNYDIIKTLEEDAFRQTLLAKNKADDAKVVIKIVNLDSLDDEYEQKAINEGNILRKVSREADHENIVKFYGSYLFDKEAVLIMEYVDGGDLKEKIEEARINKKKLEEKQIVTWVKEIASALRYCHKDKNIMHRDIKPDNILLTNDGHIKLADFGNSKMLSKKTKITKTRIGDLDYISPEIENGEEYTFSTDIWSLGVLTYELCLLQHPMTKYRLKKKKFLSEGGIPKLEDKDYSTELSDLIQKMLSVKPEERPTADEIVQVCEKLLK
jgi:NIMA (never in mitosis gene a)-related kinase